MRTGGSDPVDLEGWQGAQEVAERRYPRKWDLARMVETESFGLNSDHALPFSSLTRSRYCPVVSFTGLHAPNDMYATTLSPNGETEGVPDEIQDGISNQQRESILTNSEPLRADCLCHRFGR